MFRKLFFVLVLSLTLTSAANAELVGWWKFDETSGETAFDASGNGNDGTLNDSAQWEPAGKLGGALKLDGTPGYLQIPHSDELKLINQGDFTITMWFRQDVVTGIANLLQQTDANGTGRTLLLADSANGIRAYLGGTSTLSEVIEEAGIWYHVAMVVTEEGATDTIHFYINGEASGTPAAVGSEDCEGDYLIGTNKGLDGRWMDGLVDDFRLYNHALSEVEVLAAMEGSGGGYPYASAPDPADGVLLEATWANVSWRAGDSAVSHDVYLSDNYDDVNDGVGDSFQGNQAGTSLVVGFPGFPLPGGLIPGTSYYWRIDEVNDADPNSPWKGDVWSFTVPPKETYDPSPADGITNVLQDVTLNWTAGFGAKLHGVYFGDNLDDVNNAAGALPQMDATFTPTTLELEKTYYWRVDEFDGAETHKGDVWSFTTVPDVAVTNPNLTLWWTLDEGEGITAVDWSGHGNHGAIAGAAQWADGYQGTALTFGEDVYVEAAGYDGVTGTAARTCCAWIRTTTANRNIMSWGQNVAGQKWRMRADGTGGLRAEVNGGYHYGVTNIADGRWHHVAVTFEDDGSPDVLDTLLYVDGRLDATSASLDEPIDTAAGPVRIGESPWHNAPFLDQIDDARIYDKVLTPEEIQQVMLGNTKLAGSPVPDRTALVDIRDISSLSWSAGDAAVSHDVYFGTDRDAVAGADNSSPEFQGNQAGTSLSLAALVEYGGGDYYWRIDEIEADGTVIAGTIWQFTVPDYLIVEDFESYNDIEEDQPGSNRIYLTWIDGYGTTTNGSQAGNLDVPFMSQGHSGAQAMPLLYNNAGKISEATRTLTSKKDWTEQGVTKLVIWFSGASDNVADRMFVALGNAIVYHPDDAATQDGGWNEWVIDLQEFASQGTDLTNVGSITLGFGTRGAPVPTGGTGTVHFDDIVLVRPIQEEPSAN
ncbi:MAG: hypothetical protein CEE38_12365 [Planctomycetes bacterium B3_Pla]|nr:MAG: hypothetical protein CEE38_12365 [Planctomycetes bacterium B3_Pla]